jgi:hypothetical protein
MKHSLPGDDPPYSYGQFYLADVILYLPPIPGGRAQSPLIHVGSCHCIDTTGFVLHILRATKEKRESALSIVALTN